MNPTEALEALDRYCRARYPLIAVLSHEEDRVLSQIRKITEKRKSTLATWSITEGLVGLTGINPEDTRDPIPALEALLQIDPKAAHTIVFRDLHGSLGSRDRGFDPIITRLLRDLSAKLERVRCNLILLSPFLSIPPELEKSVAVIDWPMPDSADLAAILQKAEADSGVPVTLNGSREAVIQAMRGLTAFEATHVLASGIVAQRELGDKIVSHIVREKAQIVRKSADGAIEFFDSSVTMSDVGGLQYLKAYATRKRQILFARAQSARDAGVDTPRGVLLVGVPGTGKSLAAKAIAGGQLPLLRLDVGALFGGIVGQSEANTRNAIKLAESIAPCVVWIDEIEKALGGGGDLDGGTSQRVFGTLLTWMQETTAPVYIVATSNDLQKLKPELVSRFDNIFRVDLPDHAARVEILTVHLARRKQDLAALDLSAAANAMWGMAGREIEKAVREAVEIAYYQATPLSTAHLVNAASTIVPIAETMKDKIDYMRRQARTALPAGDPLEPKPETVQALEIED